MYGCIIFKYDRLICSKLILLKNKHGYLKILDIYIFKHLQTPLKRLSFAFELKVALGIGV